MQKALILWFASLASFYSLAQDTYRFRHFGVHEGMPAEFSDTMVQDSLGFLWIKYHGGLTRFDGYDFTVYMDESDDSLRSPRMSRNGHLVTDHSLNVWTINNQVPLPDHKLVLCRYDFKKDGFIKYFPDVNGSIVTRFCFEKDTSVIWLGTDDGGLYRFDHKLNTTTLAYQLPSGISIAGIADDRSSTLLSTADGLWIYDKALRSIHRPQCDLRDTSFFYHSAFFDIIDLNNHGTFERWLCLMGRLVKISTSFAIEQRFEFPSSLAPVSIHLDRTGIFWMPTQNHGLFRYDPRDNDLTNIRKSDVDPYSIKTDRVNAAFVDRHENLWVATSQFGIARSSMRHLRFSNTRVGPTIGGIVGFTNSNRDYIVACINATGEDEDNELLMAEMPGDEPKQLVFKHVPVSLGIKGKVSYLWKGKEKLWISTQDNGVMGLPVDRVTGQVQPGPMHFFQRDARSKNTITTKGTNGVWEDTQGGLWVGTTGAGLNLIKPGVQYGQDGSVVSYVRGGQGNLSSNMIYKEFFGTVDNSFFVITAAGFEYFQNNRFELAFKDDHPMTIHLGCDGSVYLGTWSGLLKEEQPGTRKFVPDQLFKYPAYAFECDAEGRFWVTNDVHLSFYDPARGIIVKFDEWEGFDHSRDWTFQGSTGLIASSDINGLTVFDPRQFQPDTVTATPVLTHLLLNNRELPIRNSRSDKTHSIDADITVLDQLVIPYDLNNFSISYSAMELGTPEKISYQHRMEGFDKEWVSTGWKNRTATYTNLDAGQYTFHVRASSRHGVIGNRERLLTVTVLPPPWATWWAYSSYALLVSLVLGTGTFMLVQREKLKNHLRLEHLELENARDIDRAKTAFFTNISHEFRTPLTLIKGPTQQLLDRFAKQPEVAKQLNLIGNNADALLKLVDQLLDIAKIESGNDRVVLSPVNIHQLLSDIACSFASVASARQIQFTSSLPDKLLIPIDRDKVEKILNNLLGNAVKYTPPGGSVDFTATLVGEKELRLIVKDNGIGISVTALPKIFDRFYREQLKANGQSGTGIGLALVKELVTAIGATIQVASQPGAGSEFTVILPVDWVAPVRAEGNESTQRNGVGQLVSDDEIADEESTERPMILVVEDHADLRNFITRALGESYAFLEAADGEEGLEMALDRIPDLVLADVMMPRLDGMSLVAKLRADAHTSHIPIILLTAKNTTESKLEGLTAGADHYLIKPFDSNELRVNVSNLIESRRRLAHQIRLEMMSELPHTHVLSIDDQFLSKLKESILKRLGDEQFTVEVLARDMGLSRAHFYRKVSGLTGMTANNLIKSYRLQKASDLLRQRWGSVAQVAYEVGFSNPSYFSKLFKERFGVLPSEFS